MSPELNDLIIRLQTGTSRTISNRQFISRFHEAPGFNFKFQTASIEHFGGAAMI